MTKRIFANRFGLVALMLSLFASTAAFATSQPVIVTNTTGQPVPVVGLTKDSDAPARKPFQWGSGLDTNAHTNQFFKVTTVPANQRLVIEQVSGWCGGGMLGYFALWNFRSGVQTHHQFLDATFANGTNAPASASIRFYVDPGEDLMFLMSNWSSAVKGCDMNVSGYFVNLP
jgi:opacity protein-like surface antigen